jgi:hypothetical protein
MERQLLCPPGADTSLMWALFYPCQTPSCMGCECFLDLCAGLSNSPIVPAQPNATPYLAPSRAVPNLTSRPMRHPSRSPRSLLSPFTFTGYAYCPMRIRRTEPCCAASATMTGRLSISRRPSRGLPSACITLPGQWCLPRIIYRINRKAWSDSSPVRSMGATVICGPLARIVLPL